MQVGSRIHAPFLAVLIRQGGPARGPHCVTEGGPAKDNDTSNLRGWQLSAPFGAPPGNLTTTCSTTSFCSSVEGGIEADEVDVELGDAVAGEVDLELDGAGAELDVAVDVPCPALPSGIDLPRSP